MRDEKRSDILVYVNWTNPYTNKEEELGVWLPNECVDRNIRQYFKQAFDLDIGDNDKFIEFLDIIGRSPSDLSEFADFIDLCVKDYYQTPFYKEDTKEALDDYELMNNLGEYEEEEEYVS